MRDRAEERVTLLFLRHGATKANEERRYLGKTDEPLSERGKRILLSGKAQGRYPQVDRLFCSPMKRCIETAEILYPMWKPVIIPEWTEMDFGQFEYKNYEELKEDPRYQAWIDGGGTAGFPAGESREAFGKRCARGYERMCGVLRQTVRKDKEGTLRVGIIVHGGTIMAVLSTYGKMGYFDCQAENGGGYLCSAVRREENMPPRENGEPLSGKGFQIKDITEI